MEGLNREAMTIPVEALAEALTGRIERKRAVLEDRDRRYGEGRVRIASYMENIGWPGLFGYDMNRFFSDPAFALEMDLRQKVFWLDNSLDDGRPAPEVPATLGHYSDMTLFGVEVGHSASGVPEFGLGPLAERPDLSLLEPFDFRATGAMPRLIRHYEGMRELAEARYGDGVRVTFPDFCRGPLDISVQLRGYERLVEDVAARPEFVREMFEWAVGERARWRRERRRYLGLPEENGAAVRVDDDWLNIPFITPAMFTDFVAPAYRHIGENEGDVTGFHTCGNFLPIVSALLASLPRLATLDVSGWNDFEALDAQVRPDLPFALSFINTFVLSSGEAAHREMLGRVARLAGRRPVLVCAQAIVKLHDSYEEDIGRMNRFIRLARETFARQDGRG